MIRVFIIIILLERVKTDISNLVRRWIATSRPTSGRNMHCRLMGRGQGHVTH